MVMTSKPSKKVAAPIRKRARTCIGLVGRRSIRAMIEPAVSAAEALAPPCAAIVLPEVPSSVLPNVLMSVPRPRMASMVLSERFGRIGQGRDVNRTTLAHPLARELQVARHVDRNHAANGARFQKEKTRAACVQVATYHRFNAGGNVAEDLQVHVVLIGPEPRNFRVGLTCAHQRTCRCYGLVLCVGP